MRVAFLTTEYPSRDFFTGGLANYLRRTAAGLVHRGHEVEVFTLSAADFLSEDNGVTVHGVANFTPHLRSMRRAYLLHAVDSAKLFGDFLRVHRRRRFDVIQAANNKACGLIAALARVAPVVTRVSSYQGALRRVDPTRNRPALLQRERLERLQRRFSQAVYAPSISTAREIHRLEGTAVDVVEPPFDPAGVAPEATDAELPFGSESYGLYYGRLEYLKGCDRLLAVLPGLLRENRDLRFVFVGAPEKHSLQPEFDAELRAQLSEFSGRVVVLPPLRHDRLMPVVRGARYVVFPSRSENLSNACMEAMAHQRVVVATRDASFDQLIDHGRSGYLVPQDDDDALAEVLRAAWAMSRAERETLGHSARRALATLHPDVTIPSLISYYESVIVGPARLSCAAS